MKTTKVYHIASALVEQIQLKYPEIQFNGLSKSPEGSKIYVIHLSGSHDEEKELEMREYASELSSQYLLESGYMFLFQTEASSLA